MRVFNNKAASFLAALLFLLSAGAFAQAWPLTPPLSTTDPAYFSGNSSVGFTTISTTGGLFYKKTIDSSATTAPAAVNCYANCVISHSAIKAQEGVRVGTSNVIIDRSLIELDYTVVGDHGDGLQAYSPGDRGWIIITNSTFKGTNAIYTTADLFIADNWTGYLVLQNVVFWGNQAHYGLRAAADTGGNLEIWMKNVCFVGPFGDAPMLLEDYGGGQVLVRQWENVRTCTISGSTLTLGSAIACSSYAPHCPSAGTELNVPSGVGVN